MVPLVESPESLSTVDGDVSSAADPPAVEVASLAEVPVWVG
jgi:hypothetical protein